jgi:LAGLIDADG DNA endonuclease family
MNKMNKMNKKIREILIWVILGDAHISRAGLDKAFISFEQSKKKSDYLFHLHKLAKEGGLPLMEESVKEYSRIDSRYNVNTNSLYFRTQSTEFLKPLADIFLDESGKKIILSNIAEHLTDKSLAFWIMDDGQRVKRGGVTLCTDSFKSSEINILRESLKSNFNLKLQFIIKKVKMVLFMK